MLLRKNILRMDERLFRLNRPPSLLNKPPTSLLQESLRSLKAPVLRLNRITL